LFWRWGLQLASNLDFPILASQVARIIVVNPASILSLKSSKPFAYQAIEKLPSRVDFPAAREREHLVKVVVLFLNVN
jgi:hypothetical protein